MLQVGDYVRIKDAETILQMKDKNFELIDRMRKYCECIAKVEDVSGDICRLYVGGEHLLYGWKSAWLDKLPAADFVFDTTNKEKPIMKTEINVEFELKKKIDAMVLDMIEDVRIIVPNKVVEVTFRDGTKEKAVCAEEDTYSFDTAIAICIAKYFLGGTKDYCAVIKNANKIVANKDKEAEKARIAEQQKVKRIAKFEAYKKKKAAKKLENEIEMRKEAYKRAMRELEEEKQAASCE